MNELIKVVNGEVEIDSRMIAEHFNKEHKSVLADIRDEIAKLDIAGLQGEQIFLLSSYKSLQNKELPCYTMTEEGALQLAARYDAVARRKLIIKIKELKQRVTPDTSQLSPQLQLLINMELKQRELETAITETKAEVQGIRDVVALNPTQWRKDTSDLLNKMALKLGGYQHIKFLREESYKLLDERFGVDVLTRLTNKRRRMADEGVCKSKRDKLNQLDVIADDKKLIEGYIAIIKEMAIKYGA